MILKNYPHFVTMREKIQKCSVFLNMKQSYQTILISLLSDIYFVYVLWSHVFRRLLKQIFFVKQSCNNDTLYTVELNHLKQVTDYTIAVKCTVIGSEVWSDEQLVTLTTPFEGNLITVKE